LEEASGCWDGAAATGVSPSSSLLLSEPLVAATHLRGLWLELLLGVALLGAVSLLSEGVDVAMVVVVDVLVLALGPSCCSSFLGPMMSAFALLKNFARSAISRKRPSF
jgi:hypothetical protein